ncbi:cupin domain-containing protein [Nonomuraea turkmeniaca]|uniref:Cupin domain-containing protein n=1 Tax=Nonomuraea turkmeniaca TaxID=103838 RepID=A0A5S4FI34_9ACTN|nr:cupin domain-containing protein [Nonomuraea turkmeniaca]TMR20187.1 cupin domain-containing protein [Nonomuraea turkmeniaca]
MIRARWAGGFLAATMVAAAAACAPAAERATGMVPVAGEVPVAATVSPPPSETLSPLLEQALPNVKGKTFTSAIADFPPAARAVPHRHGKAFVYAYVLEGTVRSQLSGEPVRTYRRGENWVEPPGAHHVLTENTSRTKPAKLLVIFISDTGDKIKVDDAPR